MSSTMRIGIDFDNTIVCYDNVFCDLAKSWQLIPPHYQGSKQQLRDEILTLANGDILWQRLQGKVYGELMPQAQLFAGFKEFVAACNKAAIELFIISHKTEFGHFDENRVNLRSAARHWLQQQQFFNQSVATIPETNVFFETTREEKIARIASLQCTHFIDDLIEVLTSPLFPSVTRRILFQTQPSQHEELKRCSNCKR